MNALESEYSFLAPTWKLPPVGTSSVYPNTFERSHSPSGSKLPSDLVGKTIFYD